MKRMQEHPTMWQRVDAILETSQNQQTRFFALQVRQVANSRELDPD